MSNWGGDVVHQWSSMNLMGNCGGLFHNRLDNWGVSNSNSWSSRGNKWGSCKWSSMEKVIDEWSIHNWSGNLDSWGSFDNCGSNSRSSNWSSSNLNWSSNLDSWGSVDKRSSNSWSNNSWGNGVNKTIFVQILRESLQRQGNISSLGGDQVSNGSGERSRHWSLIDIWSSTGSKEDLGVSFSFSLVKSVDILVAVTRVEGTSVARGVCMVGVGVVRGVQVGRVGFRLSQAERGYGENYDLKIKRYF